jgi:hypothetical protein
MALLSFIAVFVLLSLCLVASAEVSSTTWTRTYGGADIDEAESVIQTSDGGYAIAGSTFILHRLGYDFWLIKIDAYGNMEWNRTYGKFGADYGYSVVQTSDGGYAIAGNTYVSSSGIDCDFQLIKTDSQGNVEWQNTYGGSGTEQVYQVIATSDGGYAIAGYTFSYGAGKADFWLVKTDASGEMEWSQVYGGAKFEIPYSVVETSDGGYALVGFTESFGATKTDFWLVKTDASGNMLWNKKYGGNGIDMAYSLLATPDGGYAIAGNTDSFNEEKYDVWLIKTDANGNIEWNQTYERTPTQKFSNFLRPCSLVRALDGGYAIAAKKRSSGTGSYDFWLIKTDEQGNMEWNQAYGDGKSEQPNSLVAASDGGYVMAGYTIVNESIVDVDIDFLVMKVFGSTEPNQYDTYEYDYLFGYFTYTIVVHSNSTIEDFSFDPNQKQISFNVTGPNQTTGFCEIAIPKELLDGDFPVYMNGEPMTEGRDYIKTYNGTHTIIQITYSHSTHLIEITGTHTIPEFSTWTAPTILLAATLVVVIYKKKRST